MRALIQPIIAYIPALGTLLLALLLAGCAGQPGSAPDSFEQAKDRSFDFREIFPGAGELPGWTPADSQEVFNRENLYDLVDGQAESYFAYGFEEAAVQSYENSDGTVLRVTVWKLATPADAYGLYTTGISGLPVAVGNDGNVDEGRHLAFWQDRFYVDLFALPQLESAEVLGDLGQAVAARLPAGGERPSLVDLLPAEGLVPSSSIFFHEEISIQNNLWLGGENLLGLGPETDGILARYDVGGAPVQLLLVQYPDADSAAAALAALLDDGLEQLAAADVQDNLLGAVFGEVDVAAAEKLLAEAQAKR
jgi:hypothetical protein